MDDYISRHDAIEAICKEFMSVYCWNCANQDTDNCEDCHRKYMNWSISRETVESVINDLPSTQKKGEWISHYDYCKKYGYTPSGLISLWWCDQCEQGAEHPTNYCPNCGARMEVKTC